LSYCANVVSVRRVDRVDSHQLVARRETRVLGALIGATLAVLVWAGAPASAAAITYTPIDVTTTTDETDSGDGLTSLREAVDHADSTAGDWQINVPAGHYALDSILDVGGNSGQHIRIVGAGARTTVIKATTPTHGVVGVTSGGPVEIDAVKVTGGFSAYPLGGGGIANGGDLSLFDVTVTDNSASVGGGVWTLYGSRLSVAYSTISNNHQGSGGGEWEGGGGIFSQGSTTVVLSTISGNTAGVNQAPSSSDPPDPARGGGIASNVGGTLHLDSVTFKDNSASGGSAPAGNDLWTYSDGTSTTFNNSIFDGTSAANAAPSNCNVPPLPYPTDVSLDSGQSCVGSQPGRSSVDPKLGPLADNGGQTDTHALLPGSPAIDGVVPPSTCGGGDLGLVDQRGVARPQGSRCDVGAFELEQQATPGVTPPLGNPAGPGPGRLLEELTLSNSKFRALPRGGSLAAARAKKAPRGTVVSYRLTEAARVTFTVQKPVPGVKKGKKCVAAKAGKTGGRTHAKKCTLFKRVGGFARQSAAGLDRFMFTGRLHNRSLRPGRYRIVGVARDAAGVRSPARSATFRIVR
jgi:hypothetical protein